MMKIQYQDFTRLVLGLDNETWANHRTESALRKMILQDLDALLYYFDTDCKVWGEDNAARLALGRPQGDLSLICR
jgi:hypothetical protein